MGNQPFQTLETLQAYALARQFRKGMYEVARCLPDLEKYGLASQIRRAAVSLTNNIAEGHGRHHFRDQLKFLVQARGSLEELVDDLNICVDENYLTSEKVTALKENAAEVQRVINGYGRYLKEQASLTGVLKEQSSPYKVSEDDTGLEDDLLFYLY